MILGLSAYAHNSGLALYDGRVHLSVEEERFDRRKKSGAFPRRSLAAAHAMGLTPSDVEAIAYPWSPRHFVRSYLRVFTNDLPYSLALLRPKSSPNLNVLSGLRMATLLRRDVRGGVGRVPPLRFVEHHRAHAACAFFNSPYDEALVLVVDAYGDRCSVSAFLGQGTELREVYGNSFLNSLGVLYSCVTQHVGYRTLHDEGKVMALASMGTDALYPEFRKIVQLGDDGAFQFDFSYLNYHRAGEARPFSEKFTRIFGPARRPEEPIGQRDMDLAAALQRVLEETLLHIVGALRRRYPVRYLAYAGGVALNCVANGRLAREAGFDGVFVPPNPDDGGVPLGAAMYYHHAVLGRPRLAPLVHPFHGTEYGGDDADRALAGLPFRRVEDPAEEAAALLAEGRTVAWFQGRMEMGPRALGNRSILADPRPDGMRDHLNRNVKHREEYRPYAPSILAEAAGRWFPDAPPSPFMSFAGRIDPQYQTRVPAVIHVDGTARLQTVQADAHPLYHRLISAFARRTGVPLVLNTSLNDSTPICATPEDAVACFRGTNLDALVVGDRLALKDSAALPRRAVS
jgi:carbamoyltransferase